MQPPDDHPQATIPINTAPPALSLDLEHIRAPAFLVDKHLVLRWTAVDGSDPFSQALTEACETAGNGDIFSLMVRPAVKEALTGWQTMLMFLYTVLRRTTPQAAFDSVADALPADLVTGGVPVRDSESSVPFTVDSCLIGALDGAHMPPMRIFGMGFEAGTLFLLRRDGWPPAPADAAHAASAPYAAAPGDTKRSVGALSVRLHQSRRIAETMLPRVFFALVQHIWEETDSLAKALGGLRIASDGAQARYLFRERAGRNPVFSAICCASRILARMSALEAQHRSQWGWSEAMGVNMGISHGCDDDSDLESGDAGEFAIPGGAYDQASRLSSLAGKGEIWITKDAAGQLPGRLLDRVVLGVDRQGHFMRNLFARIDELDGAPPIAGSGGFPAARIVTIEQSASD